MLIFKILTAADRANIDSTNAFDGAPIDLADGYIHFSTAGQVAQTLAKHFQTDEALWIAAVRAGALGDDLKWEPARGGALFPHLYASLRKELIEWIQPLPIDANGRRLLPDLNTGAAR